MTLKSECKNCPWIEYYLEYWCEKFSEWLETDWDNEIIKRCTQCKEDNYEIPKVYERWTP